MRVITWDNYTKSDQTAIKLIKDQLISTNTVQLLTLMEKYGLEPLEAHIYVCTSCFGALVTYMMENPNWANSRNKSSILTAIPVEEGLMEPCAVCNINRATGFIPCFRNYVLFAKKRERGEREKDD